MTTSSADYDTGPLFSTYGLLTIKNLLKYYGVHVNDHVIEILSQPGDNVYAHMLVLPLKHLKNQTIYRHAYGYQAYVQKLFVDYLMSGEADKGEDIPGSMTRDMLEMERQNSMEIGAAFQEQNDLHKELVAITQERLIALTKSLPKLWDEKSTEAIIAGVDTLRDEYDEKIDNVNRHMRRFYDGFYQAILRITEHLYALPDFYLNPETIEQHRESVLSYNADLGLHS